MEGRAAENLVGEIILENVDFVGEDGRDETPETPAGVPVRVNEGKVRA